VLIADYMLSYLFMRDLVKAKRSTDNTTEANMPRNPKITRKLLRECMAMAVKRYGRALPFAMPSPVKPQLRNAS